MQCILSLIVADADSITSTRWVRFDTFLLTRNVSWIIWRTEYQPQQFHHKQFWQDVYSSTDVHQQDIQLPPLLSMPCIALLVTSHPDTKYEVPHKMHISLGYQRQHKSVTTLYDSAAAAGVHMKVHVSKTGMTCLHFANMHFLYACCRRARPQRHFTCAAHSGCNGRRKWEQAIALVNAMTAKSTTTIVTMRTYGARTILRAWATWILQQWC